MAYSWPRDPNDIDPQEERYDHQHFRHANQYLSSHQVKLGFDELVEDINKKNPLCASDKEESRLFMPNAPNLGSKWQSIHGAHPAHLNELISQSPVISHFQYGNTSAIGFNPTVLPIHQMTNEGDSWRNPIDIYHSAEDPRFNTLNQSSISLDKCNLQRQSGNEHHNCHRKLESSVLPHYLSYPMDSIFYRDNQGSGDVSLVEPSLMSSKDPLLPGARESTLLENVEVCAIHRNMETIAQERIALIDNKVK